MYVCVYVCIHVLYLEEHQFATREKVFFYIIKIERVFKFFFEEEVFI